MPRGNAARHGGRQPHVEVGLIYFGKRFLNPLLNRWVSADPLTMHQLGADANLYAYVSGRVLQAVDPLGLETVVSWLARKAGFKAPEAEFADELARLAVPGYGQSCALTEGGERALSAAKDGKYLDPNQALTGGAASA